MSKKEIDLGLLIAVVNQIELDADDGDYTAIECLFQFLDDPEERLKGFLRENEIAYLLEDKAHDIRGDLKNEQTST